MLRWEEEEVISKQSPNSTGGDGTAWMLLDPTLRRQGLQSSSLKPGPLLPRSHQMLLSMTTTTNSFFGSKRRQDLSPSDGRCSCRCRCRGPWEEHRQFAFAFFRLRRPLRPLQVCKRLLVFWCVLGWWGSQCCAELVSTDTAV